MDKKRRSKVENTIVTKQAENDEEEKEVVNPWDAMWGIGHDRSEDVELENVEQQEEETNDENEEDKEDRDFWFNW